VLRESRSKPSWSLAASDMRPECHGGSDTCLQPSQLGEHNLESSRPITVVRNGLDVFLQARRGAYIPYVPVAGFFTSGENLSFTLSPKS
jgi:hypothetical protein